MKVLKRAFAALVALACAIGPSSADQSALSLPTTGTLSGLSLVGDVNAAVNALASCNSGASAPTNTLAGAPIEGQCWINTSATRHKLEIYDGGAWLVVATYDSSLHVWMPALGGGVGSYASATTVDLGSTAETFLTITGTTNISSFGTSAPPGAAKVLTFAGALTLTYNATSLILPTGANIVTAAGDTAIAVPLGGGNWRVVSYSRATGSALTPQAIPAGVPSGAVMAFNLTTCPSGWTYADGTSGTADSRGLFIRGWDRDHVRDPDGTRAIAGYQADAMQTFGVNSPYPTFAVTGNYAFSTSSPVYVPSGNGPVGDTITGSPRFAAETRPVNIDLLYCQKN